MLSRTCRELVTVGLMGPIGHARCQGLTPAQLNLKATIENVTEIPDEASPDFLKTFKIELHGTRNIQISFHGNFPSIASW
jgi:hypothetical protein